jgi:glycosyltransferase involved in cell wall biosynthesis
MFVEQKCEVLLLGIITEGTERLDVEVYPGRRVKLLPKCPPGIRQKLHFLLFCVWVIAHALLWRPNWIYVSDWLATPVGWLLLRLGQRRIVYHEHDSPAWLYTRYEKLTIFVRIVLHARSRLAKRAAICIVPNETRAREFQAEVRGLSPVHCIWNCPSLREVVSPRLQPPRPQLKLFFHGSIVPQRLPMALIEGLKDSDADVSFTFAGYETIDHASYVDRLLERSRQLGIADRVRYLGPLSRTDSLRMCAESDVGVSFMPTESDDINLRAMVGASNKPFDYLACGLALLVSNQPEWVRTFVEPGFGFACDPDSRTSIAGAIKLFARNPSEYRKMGEAGRQQIVNYWNYEARFAEVAATMISGAIPR